jgi:methylglutaconyl-CoA hydratase
MLKSNIKSNVIEISISRPEVKNALNSELITLLINKLEEIENNKSLKVLVIKSENGVFSSGADLNWLRDVNHLTYDELYQDSLNFVKLLNKINNFPIPVISIVDGAAIGGGAGIALCSDIIIASEKAVFGISELHYGIVPAAIVPIVKKRIGETKAREYLLTGERINAEQALQIGMINYVKPDSELEDFADKLISKIYKNAPLATYELRQMIRQVDNYKDEELDDYIAKTIADLRISDEGKEGINAFLEKRKAGWH